MRYLIAIPCPPLAVLLCGKPIQAVVSAGLCICCIYSAGLTWVIAILHAWAVVAGRRADARAKQIVAAIGRRNHR